MSKNKGECPCCAYRGSHKRWKESQPSSLPKNDQRSPMQKFKDRKKDGR